MSRENIKIYQIYYNEETKAYLEPEFIPLYNSQDERPDWFEFWAIKSFLEKNELQDDVIYGFVSPKFTSKTHIEAQSLINFIEQHIANFDVFLINTPFFSTQSYHFLNCFEQGNDCHFGLKPIAEQVLKRLNLNIDLNHMVTHSENFAFSNYIFAKKQYWLEWKKLADKFFDLCESFSFNSDDPLLQALHINTNYEYPVQMKIFIQERLPALLLQQAPYNCITFSKSDKIENYGKDDTLLSLLNVCNLLKINYCNDHNPNHLAVFHYLRNLYLNKLNQC